MPQQMSSQDVLRELRRIRFSPRKGRRITIAEIARLAGYQPPSLFRVARRGSMSKTMAQRLGQVFDKTITVSGGHIAWRSSLGTLDDGRDPRGRPRLPGPRYPCGALRPRARGDQAGTKRVQLNVRSV
jgi:hypothetical protein